MIEIQRLRALEAKRFIEWVEPPADGSPVVTLVLPMERKGAATRKNSIFFKNALTQAREIVETNWPNQTGLLQAIEDPCMEELKQPTAGFWQYQEGGLILVIREGVPPLAFATPFGVEPFVFVGDRPYLAPALRLLDSLKFVVVVLDLNDLRVFETTQWQSIELDIDFKPRSLDEAMRYDDPEKFLQVRSVSGSNLPGPGAGNVAFHGHGANGRETRKKKIRRFFEMASASLARNLPNQDQPVVLCGPESEVGFFRQIYGCRRPRLCEQDIVVNPSSLSRTGLEELLGHWVAERNAAQRREACSRVESLLGTSASTRFDEVVRAAMQDRVASLNLRPDCHRFGHFDRETGEVTTHEEWLPGDTELVSEAALAAAASGSEIRCYEASEPMPEGASLTAIFRY